MESRRSLLKMAVVGGAAAFVPLPKAPVQDRQSRLPDQPKSPAPRDSAWQLLHPLAPGSEVALGWSIVAISPVIEGATIVHLVSDRGEAARVRVCRNDGNPLGVAHTQQYDLLLMNGGRGDTPTDEDLGRVLLTIAGVMAKNEDRVATPWPELKSHREHLASCRTTLA